MLPQALFISDDLAPILIGVTVLFFLLLVSILLFFMFFYLSFLRIAPSHLVSVSLPYYIYARVRVRGRGVVSVVAGLSGLCGFVLNNGGRAGLAARPP